MSDFITSFSEITGVKHPEVGIYRGSQPEAESDWMFLKNNGVNQIIKLNSELLHEETAMCRQYGIKLFYAPITFGEQLVTEPELNALRCAIAFIQKGTFIHCLHGQDRTGLVVGLYRVNVLGWSKHDAFKEMLNSGYHPILLGLNKAWNDLTQPIKS